MREVTVLSVLLCGLAVASYLTQFEKSEKKEADTKVTLIDTKPADLKSVSLIAKTQTVAVSRKEDARGPYWWFEVETKTGVRGFVGNKEADDLMKKFAPFEAVRSLGSELKKEDLGEAKLEKPERKLIVRYGSGEKVWDIGGRTYGSRDHYLRPKGQKDVVLVEARILGDLEYPEGRFMQRKLREVEDKDVTEAIVKGASKERKILHQNRLSQSDAYWADPEKPDQRNETLENFLDKVDKLTVRRYATAKEPFPKFEPIIEVAWLEDGKEKERVIVSKAGQGPSATFYAESGSTRQAVEISKPMAEQLENDLKSLF